MIATWKAVDPCPHTNHMPNSPQCNECRNIDLGWNYDLAEYVKRAPAQPVIIGESLPFDGDVRDPHWDRALEQTRNHPQRYIYRGDRLTDDALKGMICTAVKQPNDKCITGKTGVMLVEDLSGVRYVVLRWHLRKVKEAITQDADPIRMAG